VIRLLGQMFTDFYRAACNADAV